MNMEKLPSGLWPVMVTPFNYDGSVDYDAYQSLVDYYIDAGVSGLFACCGSSEITHLTKDEMLRVLECVLMCNAGRVPVVSGAIIFEPFEAQIEFAKSVASLWPQALIISPTQLVEKDDNDQVLFDRFERYTEAVGGDIKLGTYEFPYPYHRLLTPAVMEYMVSSGRYIFHKDTSCSMDNMRVKLDILKGSRIMMVNAHTHTVLESLQAGGDGFCGCTANYCPELYVWLCRNFAKYPQKAAEVQKFLSDFENQADVYDNYPVSAKAYMRMRGVDITHYSRKLKITVTPPQIEQLTGMLANATSFFKELESAAACSQV